MPTLAFSHLRKSYGATMALQDVDFEVRSGEVFGLLGPNGAGKTTLLRILMGLLDPDAGTILLDGRPVGQPERERTGYLPEERGLYRKEKVDDVLIYFGMLKGLERGVARRRAGEWLQRLGLAGVGRRRVDTLSKGMQQQVQIAATFLHDPAVLVLDEPFAGLDPINTVMIKDLLREMSRAGRLVILSTHQMPMVEELCDRVAMIDRGRIVLYGEVEAIRRRQGETEVLVLTDGDLASLTPVARATREGALTRVVLAAGARPRELLALLAARGHAVDHFEVARTPLEEIFVRTVRAGQARS